MKNSHIIKYFKKALTHNDAATLAAVKKMITKLKKKGRKLKLKRAGAKTSQEISALDAKIKVNRAQRKKGVEAYRKLSGKD